MTQINNTHANLGNAASQGKASWFQKSAEGGDALTRQDNTVQTGRYSIEVTKGRVAVFDTQTETWVHVWDDPSLLTSDGDKGHFEKDSLTMVLRDGTKLTMTLTNPDQNGTVLIDQVGIMRGTKGIIVKNVAAEPRFGAWIDAKSADAAHTDGTVLVAGHEVDDLRFVADRTELRGQDWNDPKGEHSLDGRGGEAPQFGEHGPQPPTMFHSHEEVIAYLEDLFGYYLQGMEGGAESSADDQGQHGGQQHGHQTPNHHHHNGGPGHTHGTPYRGTDNNPYYQGDRVSDIQRRGNGGVNNADRYGNDFDQIYQILRSGGGTYSVMFLVLRRLDVMMQDKVRQLEELTANGVELDNPQNIEVEIERLTFEIQRIRQLRQQVSTTLTNLLKVSHDTNMSIIGNIRP